jgi:hypothetical protein
MVSRRRLWWPLLLAVVALIACGLMLFRQIGLWELGIILAPVALVFVIESTRYVAGQFKKGYRRRPPAG